MTQCKFDIFDSEKADTVLRPLDTMVRRFPNYAPYTGFYDLRCYEIPKKIFLQLWNIQDMLSHMNQKKDYYKKWHPAQWQKAQLMSADYYQQILFRYA